ncbi:DUF6356 family protein [Thetidibacter halocola]|uniref:Capsule biosynthesis protein n=1 Tax=Thetidibacter halocola TaxID=2827239 RepID=A0A8J8B758_9RHOB|nr:DUF6356 family protein [Thetidibacter halocola]MBS0124756.1 hypothetical protein [Thetidibacter halocola]
MTDITPPRTQQTLLARIFLAHPESVGEGYFDHMKVALHFWFWLSVAAGAALVHALVPALCEKTASTIVRRLHDRMTRRVPH